jgi:hypothetical protein
MKTTITVFLSGLVLLSFNGCGMRQHSADQRNAAVTPAKRSEPMKTSATKSASGQNFPIVGYLKGRDETITIKAGPQGPLYSVQSADGRTRFQNVTLEQLRAQAPDLHDLLKGSVAGGGGSYIDASLLRSAVR